MDADERLRRLLKSRRANALSASRPTDKSLGELAEHAGRSEKPCCDDRRQQRLRDATRMRMVEALRNSVTQLRPLLAARAAEDAQQETTIAGEHGNRETALVAARASREQTAELLQQLDHAESLLSPSTREAREPHGADLVDAMETVRVLKQELIRPGRALTDSTRGTGTEIRASRNEQRHRLRMLRRRPPRPHAAGAGRVQPRQEPLEPALAPTLEPDTEPQTDESEESSMLADAVRSLSECLLAALAAVEGETAQAAVETGECWTDLTVESLSQRLRKYCSKISGSAQGASAEMDSAANVLRQAAMSKLTHGEESRFVAPIDGRYSCAGLCAVLSAASALATSQIRPKTNNAGYALEQLHELQVTLLGFAPVEHAPWLLDAHSKAWLLHLFALAADPPPVTETIVVARQHAFLDSVGVLAPYASLSLNRQLQQTDEPRRELAQCLQLRPFFRKRGNDEDSDSNGVEEGEGRGPLLEYVGLVGVQLAAVDAYSAAAGPSRTEVVTNRRENRNSGSQIISMLGYHQGSEGLWFADSDATIQALPSHNPVPASMSVPPSLEQQQQQDLEGQRGKAGKATGRCGQSKTVVRAFSDGDEAQHQSDAHTEPEDDDSTSIGTAAMLAERWCAAGVILGAALTSRCSNALSLNLNAVLLRILLLPTSDVSLSSSTSVPLMQHLCQSSVTEAIRLLQSYDPSIASMAQLVLNEDGQGLSNDDFCSMLELESLDDSSPSITREQYVLRMVRTLVLEPVEMQLDALRAGWSSVLPHGWLAQLAITPAELRVMLGGASDSIVAGKDATPDFSWRSAFQVVEDPELLDGSPTLRSAFWQAMEDSLSPAEKRQVLTFVTGIDRPPAPRSGELLRIEMPFVFIGDNEKKGAWGTLPQAHTCSNTLELPNYCEAWKWHRQYEFRRRTKSETQRGAPDEEAASLATGAQEDGAQDEDPTVEELAGLIRDRLLTAACGSQGYALDAL